MKLHLYYISRFYVGKYKGWLDYKEIGEGLADKNLGVGLKVAALGLLIARAVRNKLMR